MNALLPRRSASSACLFCRQGLVRQWRLQQQQQRQHVVFGRSTASSTQPLFAPSQQRRRYLSGTAAAQMPPPPFAQSAEQPTETSTATPSSSSSSSSPSKTTTTTTTSPYTRYSLYPTSVPPMTMRPPPPPPPVVPADTPAKTAKEALQETTPDMAAATVQQPKPAETEAAKEEKSKPATATAAATTPTPVAAPKPKRPSKLRAPRKAAIRLTPAAVDQIRELLEGPEPKLVKVGVRNRGCSGLSYSLEYVEKPGAFDEAVEQDGVKVLVDSKALFSIVGSEMDWQEDKLNQRFVFRNPNIKDECGCGESFMV